MNKIYKTLDWILLGLSYIPAVLILVGVLFNYYAYTSYKEIADTLVGVGFGTYIFILVINFGMYIFGGIVGAMSKQPFAKHTMIIKLAYIPFFIINFVDCVFSMIGGADVPALAVPLLGIFLIFNTYVLMFRTSFLDIVHYIKRYIKKETKVSTGGILCLIGLFFFCIDVLAAILLYANERKYRKENNPEFVKRRKKQIEKWNTKKGMNFTVYKVCSLIGTIISYVAVIGIIAAFIYTFAKSDSFDETSFRFALTTGITVVCNISLCVALIFKLVIGLIYGKCGKTDPTDFVTKMKYVNLPLAIIIWGMGIFAFVFSSVLGVVGAIFLPVIVVIVIALLVFACIIVAGYMFMFGVGCMASLAFVIYSENLTIFLYYMNQRKMNNRRFAGKLPVFCMTFMWFPVLDLIGLSLMKPLIKEDKLFGEKPLIEELK